MTETQEHHETTIDGVRLHWVRAGSGTPVVLLHGWPQTWYAWRKVIPALARDHEVFAVDLPGLGDSGSSPRGHGVRIAADLLDAWRAELGLGRVHVVGHDLGGPIGYTWAAAHPGHVRSFSLLAVVLHGFGLDELIARAGLWHFGFFAVPGLAEELAEGRERVLLEHFYAHAMESGAIRPADVDVYLRSYARPGRLANGFAYYRNVAADTAAIADLARTPLPMPTLAVGGGLAGGPAPLDSLTRVAPATRGAVIEDSGHFLPEERPEPLLSLLRPFLAEADASVPL
ncbi:alpha/beta fold hydrolase [Streptomyces hygroscopicus]|uniref:alpha/beta fold hydrolase n=1 Tax=Streptomyces hygroscopicus TaxID=1912 RepID=UPI0007674586|nr:alpha/beta fold hydrolase [Streptomyces hygroscopicus]